MATVGNTSVGANVVRADTAFNGRAHVVTMPEDGTAVSLWAHLVETTTNNAHVARMAIYAEDSASSALLDSSDTRADITTVAAWIEFTGLTGISLVDGTTYTLALTASGGSGQLNLAEAAGTDTGDGRGFVPAAPPTFDDPEDLSFVADELYSIYLEYTPDSDDISISVPAGPWQNKHSHQAH